LNGDLLITPFLDSDLTAAANAAASAHAVKIDAELARGLENGGSRGKAAAFARRCKDYREFLGHGV
jgi:hypothetical protein